jgi:HK97 family phage major capsid protein
VLGFQNAISNRPAPSTTAVEYSRYTGMQGAAAQQAAEGDAKAAVRPDHSLITQTAITIAGYAKMSRQAMNDSAELKRAIDVTLNRSVATALDVALVNGATGFAGGYETLATASTSLVYTALVDAISEGVAAMQVAGFNPDVVSLNPADWLAVTVMKSTTGEYLSGAYLGAMPSEMRGLRVVLSPSVDAGKALLIDSSHSELLVVNGFQIEVAFSGTDFVENLCTVLGEVRVIPTFRTVGSARLITPKA